MANQLPKILSRLRHRLWLLVVAALIAAQVGLLVHQSRHHVTLDARASEACVVCQLASNLATGPAPPLLILPLFVLLGEAVLAVATAPAALRLCLSFRSRAPPSIHA